MQFTHAQASDEVCCVTVVICVDWPHCIAVFCYTVAESTGCHNDKQGTLEPLAYFT